MRLPMYWIADGYYRTSVKTILSEDRAEFNDLTKCMQYAMMESNHRKASMYIYRTSYSDRGFPIKSDMVAAIHHPNQNIHILFPWCNVNN